MEGRLAADVDEWISSHVVEVEVSSEENPVSSSLLNNSLSGKVSIEKTQNFFAMKNLSLAKSINLPEEDIRPSFLKMNETKHKLSVCGIGYEFDKRCKRFKCKKCEKVFLQKTSVINHLQNNCGFKSKQFCPLCSFETNSKFVLNIHIAKLHNNSQPTNKAHREPKTFKKGMVIGKNESLCLKNLVKKSQINKADDNWAESNYLHRYPDFGLESRCTEANSEDSASYSESNSDSEKEEEAIKKIKKDEKQNTVDNMNEEENLKNITAFLEKRSQSDHKGVYPKKLSGNAKNNCAFVEPKKLVRFININGFDSKYTNHYSNLDSYRKVSNALEESPANIEVKFIKVDTPSTLSSCLTNNTINKFTQSKSCLYTSCPKVQPESNSFINDIIEEANLSDSIGCDKKSKYISKKEKQRNSLLLDVSGDLEYDSELDKFKCKRCKKFFKRKMCILNHLRNICGIEPKHECSLCPYKTKSSFCLKVHIAKVHSGSQPRAKNSKTLMPDKNLQKGETSYNLDSQETKHQNNSETCLSHENSLSFSEESYDSDFESGKTKKSKKVVLWKENEFVYNVKEDIFKCKSCLQVFKSKGVVALHKHVVCNKLQQT